MSSPGTLGVHFSKTPCPIPGCSVFQRLSPYWSSEVKTFVNLNKNVRVYKITKWEKEGLRIKRPMVRRTMSNVWKMQSREWIPIIFLILPTPALLNIPGSTSMMWLGQYFRYSGISYSLTTRRWRWLMPSMAWKRFRSPCSWRPLEGVKIGLLTAFRFCERKTMRAEWESKTLRHENLGGPT